MTSGSLYEQVLAAQGSSPPASPRPPRPSASVVLWRHRGRRLEVFWVRRSSRVRFMPGWHAFPGGSLSRTDTEVEIRGLPRGMEAGNRTPLPPGSAPAGEGQVADLVPGLVATALRELFEETGVLPAPELATPLSPGQRRELEAARLGLLEGETTFGRALEALGVTPDASELVFAGRWLTPPFAPLRFDNRFFLLRWPSHRPFQPQVLPGELDSGEWITPREGIERWRRAEMMTAPPILHVLTTLAEDGPEEGLARLRDPAEADLGPHRRVEFRPGILLFPLATPTLPPATHTNCYLVGTGDCVLVDPGSPGEGEQEHLLAALTAARERLGRRVTAVWLTHHHPDHVGGATAVATRLGVPILAHPGCAEHLEDRGLQLDGELVDGQRSELPGDPPTTVTVVHTPGHARGHLAFLVDDHRSLLCGDLVSALSTIVIDPPDGDMGSYLRSLDRVLALEPATLLPGHGPTVFPAGPFLRRFIAHRRWREERILRAWQNGYQEPDEILPRAYDEEELPDAVRPLARRQVVAHLQHLEATGRLRP